MAMPEADRDLIRALADLLEEKGLTEIEYEHHGLRLRVGRTGLPAAVHPDALPASAAVPPPDPAPAAPDESDDSVEAILSPMVGTFYAAASPESPAFVQVGDRVRKGQVVCIIEAMKLMNEIESEYDGVVAERLVENAHGVEFGQALFHIRAD